ncbi:phage-shock protein [Thermodesulfobacteriota bacterium]
MEGVFITVIILGGIVLALAVIGSTILMGLKIIKGGAGPAGQKTQTDEAKIIQEIFQGLGRMEERVEALETILLEREKERKEGNQ